MKTKFPNTGDHTASWLPLAERIIDFFEQQKGIEPVILPLEENGFADALVVTGANSRRHCRGLADGVASICNENGQEFFGMEGYETGEWILVDCNEVIVNIFLEETRALYRLEELWGKKAFRANMEKKL